MSVTIDEFNNEQKKPLIKEKHNFVIMKKIEYLTKLKVNSLTTTTKKPYTILLESPFIFYSKYTTFIWLKFLRKGFFLSKIPMSGITLSGLGFYLFFNFSVHFDKNQGKF